MNPSEHLQAAQRAELQCLTGMFDVTLDGLDQLSSLQLQALRDLAQHGSRSMREALDAREPQQWAGLPNQALRGDGERAAQYLQRLGEIAGSMQAGFAQALQQGMDDMQRAWKSVAEAAPAQADGQTDWMRGPAELLAQAMQSWSRSQAQVARSLNEQMQRLTQGAAAPGAEPDTAPPAARRAAPRRTK